MPLYEYKCEKCGLKFEELIKTRDDAVIIPCRSCGSPSMKQVSSFAPVVAGGSSNETVDMSIGREANKRWQHYTDTQTKRRGTKKLEKFDLPKSKDGKYMPVMALGEKNKVEQRKEYVTALQEHRKSRKQRGIDQFNGTGSF